jgi:hypothetical protein
MSNQHKMQLDDREEKAPDEEKRRKEQEAYLGKEREEHGMFHASDNVHG